MNINRVTNESKGRHIEAKPFTLCFLNGNVMIFWHFWKSAIKGGQNHWETWSCHHHDNYNFNHILCDEHTQIHSQAYDFVTKRSIDTIARFKYDLVVYYIISIYSLDGNQGFISTTLWKGGGSLSIILWKILSLSCCGKCCHKSQHCMAIISH